MRTRKKLIMNHKDGITKEKDGGKNKTLILHVTLSHKVKNLEQMVDFLTK